MVLTVTLNPLFEKKYFFHNIELSNNRAYKQVFSAGGKGINISRQLNLLGIKNHALTFLGGSNGKKLRAILESENISFSAVSVKSEVREASLIFDDDSQKLTTYFSPNSEITASEIDQFVQKLEKAIINSSIVVFSGSLPNNESSIIIEKGIELCHKHDKISILDSYGNLWKKHIALGPTIIHNNLHEIEKSLSISTSNEEEIRKVLDILYKNNVKMTFLSSGKNDTYAAKSNFHYRIKNPKIVEKNPTGSGDAFVSGIIYGLEKSLIFNDFIKIASVLGAQNASTWDVCNVDIDEARKLIDQVNITEIGKKMKLIDDSPTI